MLESSPEKISLLSPRVQRAFKKNTSRGGGAPTPPPTCGRGLMHGRVGGRYFASCHAILIRSGLSLTLFLPMGRAFLLFRYVITEINFY